MPTHPACSWRADIAAFANGGPKTYALCPYLQRRSISLRRLRSRA
ncbi:hypothetical protein [Alloprevotella tannerae]|nr:hypothetical protein [Alloprevotella tannerae]